jgi:hypothetical protein
VQSLTGKIDSASVRVYVNSNSSAGYAVHGVADNSWSELTMTYSDAPAFGTVIGSSGAFSSNSWTEVDVTSLVSGEGELSLALTGLTSTAASYSSREGSKPPELIVITN